MTGSRTEDGVNVLRIDVEQRTYPPYDAFHGTPHAMLWRQVRIEMADGGATFEQTDYGHPGRLNAWEPRGIDNRLLPRLRDLVGVVEAIGSLL